MGQAAGEELSGSPRGTGSGPLGRQVFSQFSRIWWLAYGLAGSMLSSSSFSYKLPISCCQASAALAMKARHRCIGRPSLLKAIGLPSLSPNVSEPRLVSRARSLCSNHTRVS